MVATHEQKQISKISWETQKLIEKKRKQKRMVELNKLISEEIRKDIRKYNVHIIMDTMRQNKWPKAKKKKSKTVIRNELQNYYAQLNKNYTKYTS